MKTRKTVTCAPLRLEGYNRKNRCGCIYEKHIKIIGIELPLIVVRNVQKFGNLKISRGATSCRDVL